MCKKKYIDLFTCKKMIDFINMVSFRFCEFHFLRYFLSSSNVYRILMEKGTRTFLKNFVNFLDVIGRVSEMNPFILSKSGFVRKKTWLG